MESHNLNTQPSITPPDRIQTFEDNNKLLKQVVYNYLLSLILFVFHVLPKLSSSPSLSLLSLSISASPSLAPFRLILALFYVSLGDKTF